MKMVHNNAFAKQCILSCLVAGAVCFVSAPARATSCIGRAEFLIPESTSQVPSNTLIWTTGRCENGILTKKGGAVVPFSIRQLGAIQALQPESELEIGATYDLTDCDAFGGVTTTFTVTSGADTTPPNVPVFQPGDTYNSIYNACGEYELVQLDVVPQDDLLVLDIASRSTLDPTTLTGAPVDFFSGSHQVVIGNQGRVRSNWSFEDDGDAVDTRLGAFDLAGNFSGMSAPQTIQLGCGCTTVQSSNSTDALFMAVFVGLVFSGVHRRRKAQKP